MVLAETSGLSWPSTVPVCSALYSSAKATGVGFAPIDSPRNCQNSPGGMRSLTPADMAGIKLRMPPGEFWQFLGESIGANPTPVAYAEVYTALQTGAIDGQDNPLVASKLMKFYEVTTQFVMTGHVIGYDVMTISGKIWDAMTPAQQTAFQAAAEKAIDDYVVKFSAQEKEVLDFFKANGKKVYTPDLNAFRTFAQKKYLDKYGQDWPKGALERINAL